MKKTKKKRQIKWLPWSQLVNCYSLRNLGRIFSIFKKSLKLDKWLKTYLYFWRTMEGNYLTSLNDIVQCGLWMLTFRIDTECICSIILFWSRTGRKNLNKDICWNILKGKVFSEGRTIFCSQLSQISSFEHLYFYKWYFKITYVVIFKYSSWLCFTNKQIVGLP